MTEDDLALWMVKQQTDASVNKTVVVFLGAQNNILVERNQQVSTQGNIQVIRYNNWEPSHTFKGYIL